MARSTPSRNSPVIINLDYAKLFAFGQAYIERRRLLVLRRYGSNWCLVYSRGNGMCSYNNSDFVYGSRVTFKPMSHIEKRQFNMVSLRSPRTTLRHTRSAR